MDGSSVSQVLPALKTTESTLFDRWVARSRWPRWAIAIGIGAIIFLIPFVLALLEGVGFRQLFDYRGIMEYRAQLVYALIVAFVLALPIEGTRTGVALALRPLLQVDDDLFVSVVNRSCRVRMRSELIALGLGLLLGLAINLRFEPLESTDPLHIYAYLSRIALFGFMGWSLFLVMSITRMTNALLRLPITVDIFQLQPFVPIGRQSVWLSLTLVGAVTISLLSVSFGEQALWLEYVMVYSFLLVSIVVIFLLNTHSVHRVLAAAKHERMGTIEGYLSRACRRFEDLLSAAGDTHAVATEVNALAILKQEIKQAQTWPYNTAMLRTMSISIVTPLAMGLSRVILAVLTGNLF